MPLPTKGPLYPKLPSLKSNDIQWDDDDWQPHAISGVFGSQTLPSTTQKNSGVYVDSQAVKREMR
jgi:hypothetical protein